MSITLGTPITLPCGAIIPNRIGKSAMTEGLANPHDDPTPAHQTLYQKWSDGGTGLLITGNVMVDKRYLERAGNVVLENDSAMNALSDWVKAGTRNGNQLWMQISHPGRQCARMVNKEPLSPSTEQLKLAGNFCRPLAMTEEQILDVIERFTTTARLAKQAGFTGVQVHCAHGYLISQFLSPITNKRSDRWGGSLENRARFALDVVSAVRSAVGPEFPVSVKLNSSDFQKGGFTLEECVQVAGWLSDIGIDLLEISGGSYEQLSLFGAESDDIRESTRKREAYFIEYATAIREAAQIPVMVTGGFRSRAVMESALANGEVDLVGLARPLCIDPTLSNKLLNAEIDHLPCQEEQLILGSGWLGNKSTITLVQVINTVGQIGYYYWQIIRLSRGLPAQPELGVFRAFLRHSINDLKLNFRRVK